jgi:hypothetical protein|tara:strand:+ start:1731 stop:2135 length:405 start_codon:yes stop_codon:yes gene_type:complete
MADAVTSQTIQDGQRTAIMKFTNLSDATGETNVAKVSVASLEAQETTGAACTSVTVQSIQFVTYGLAVRIDLDATANVLLATLPENYSDSLDFSDYGVPNNAGGGVTGDILFSTIGAGAGDSYMVVLTMTKNYG